LQQAIECKKEFGHGATIWNTWDALYDLEQANHNPIAAHAAKHQAIQSYLAYRRDRGENTSNSKVLQYCYTTLQAIQGNNSHQALTELADLQNHDELSNRTKTVISKLIAILQGVRTPNLADDPELDYNCAAELLLLLEQLN